MQTDTHRTRALPEEGDPTGIPPEPLDVLLHPEHRRFLIMQAVVAVQTVWCGH